MSRAQYKVALKSLENQAQALQQAQLNKMQLEILQKDSNLNQNLDCHPQQFSTHKQVEMAPATRIQVQGVLSEHRNRGAVFENTLKNHVTTGNLEQDDPKRTLKFNSVITDRKVMIADKKTRNQLKHLKNMPKRSSVQLSAIQMNSTNSITGIIGDQCTTSFFENKRRVFKNSGNIQSSQLRDPNRVSINFDQYLNQSTDRINSQKTSPNNFAKRFSKNIVVDNDSKAIGAPLNDLKSQKNYLNLMGKQRGVGQLNLGGFCPTIKNKTFLTPLSRDTQRFSQGDDSLKRQLKLQYKAHGSLLKQNFLTKRKTIMGSDRQMATESLYQSFLQPGFFPSLNKSGLDNSSIVDTTSKIIYSPKSKATTAIDDLVTVDESQFINDQFKKKDIQSHHFVVNQTSGSVYRGDQSYRNKPQTSPAMHSDDNINFRGIKKHPGMVVQPQIQVIDIQNSTSQEFSHLESYRKGSQQGILFSVQEHQNDKNRQHILDSGSQKTMLTSDLGSIQEVNKRVQVLEENASSTNNNLYNNNIKTILGLQRSPPNNGDSNQPMNALFSPQNQRQTTNINVRAQKEGDVNVPKTAIMTTRKKKNLQAKNRLEFDNNTAGGGSRRGALEDRSSILAGKRQAQSRKSDKKSDSYSPNQDGTKQKPNLKVNTLRNSTEELVINQLDYQNKYSSQIGQGARIQDLRASPASALIQAKMGQQLNYLYNQNLESIHKQIQIENQEQKRSSISKYVKQINQETMQTYMQIAKATDGNLQDKSFYKGDSNQMLRNTFDTIEKYKQELKRVVSKRSELIVDLPDKVPTEFKLIQGINLNIKISTVDKQGPLKIVITYPKDSDGQVQKLVKCYYSWDTMMPNQKINDGYINNPDKLVFESSVKDHRTGKEKFVQPNLYLMFQPIFDCSIKLCTYFKETMKKVQKVPENEQVIKQQQSKKVGNMLDSLQLNKSSTNSTNRNKIEQFVQNFLTDKQAYYQLCDICDKIKYQRSQSQNRQSQFFTGIRARDLIKQFTNLELEKEQILLLENQSESNKQPFFITGLSTEQQQLSSQINPFQKSTQNIFQQNKYSDTQGSLKPDNQQYSISLSNGQIQENEEETITIMKNNQEIAPIYRYFLAEKRSRYHEAFKKKHENARVKSQAVLEKKREQDQFHLMKWDVFRQLIDYLIDEKVKILRKQRLIREWIELTVAHHRINMLAKNLALQRTFKQRKLLRSLKSQVIKQYFRKRKSLFGANTHERIRRKIPHLNTLYINAIQDPVKIRSKILVTQFLRNMMRAKQLTIKTKQYYLRMINVQKNFVRSINHTKYKTHILKHIFTEFKDARLMQVINDKDTTAQELISSISDDTINEVLKRYIVFCKDQSQIIFNKYRRAIKRLTPAELTGLKLRQTYSVKVNIQLYDSLYGKFNYEKDKLGGFIDCLIPCLDPDTPIEQRDDYDIVSKRVNSSDIRITMLNEPITAHQLAQFEPYFWQFVPSPRIMEKLLMKMAHLQDAQVELWQGFQVPFVETLIRELGEDYCNQSQSNKTPKLEDQELSGD